MSTKRDEMLGFYTDVLDSLRIKVDKNGKATTILPDGEEAPTVVNGKPLFIPKKGTLDNGNLEKIQAFHPICESLPRKTPSPVIAYMMTVAKANIGIYLKIILERLMEVAADPSLHSELPPEATDYLTKVPNAKPQTVKKLKDIINKAVRKKAFVSIYCKNGGKFQGENVTRLCTIRFPIIDMIDKNELKSLKVSFSSERERKTIQALFHYVLPLGDDPEEYSAASNAKIAPFLEAFLLAYQKVVVQLNKMLDRHGSSIDFELENFPTKAFNKIDMIGEYYNGCGLGILPGNEGGIKEIEESQQTESATPPNPNAASNVQAPPWGNNTPAQPQPAKAPTAKSGGQSVDDFVNALNAPAPQYPNSFNNGYQQPMQQQNAYANFQQPLPQQQGGPFDTLRQQPTTFGGYNQPAPQSQFASYGQPQSQFSQYQQPQHQGNMNNNFDAMTSAL